MHGMAAQISEITESNQDVAGMVQHILTDLHELLKVQARHDALLEEFRPLLNQFRTPAASMMAGRRARKAAR